MKKFLFVCVAFAISLLFTKTTSAQSVKIGYFDEQSVLTIMPGIDKVDSTLKIYERDSIGVEYQYRYNDYLRRDSIYKKDSATMPAKAREIAEGELNQLKSTLINWQQIAQQMYQNKTEQLVAPYRKQIYDALNQIVADLKYTYVLNQSALSDLVRPPLLDNLSIRVAMKLKLPLSKEIEDAWKAAVGAASAPKK
jgi:Skp family chaperone for outer membrane proteins